MGLLAELGEENKCLCDWRAKRHSTFTKHLRRNSVTITTRGPRKYSAPVTATCLALSKARGCCEQSKFKEHFEYHMQELSKSEIIAKLPKLSLRNA